MQILANVKKMANIWEEILFLIPPIKVIFYAITYLYWLIPFEFCGFMAEYVASEKNSVTVT